MSQLVKKILKRIHLYHPLQGFYRAMLFRLQKNKLNKQYQQYRGPGFQCNYCGSCYSRFAPWHPDAADEPALRQHNVVAGYGENILCPHCLSTARERLLKAMVSERIEIKNKKILHISPEKLFYRFIQQQAAVTTVDYEPGFYKAIDPSVQFADATQLSFGNEAFDILIGNHIMEHIPDDLKAMKEIYRVLKPGGIAILQVPFSVAIPCTLEEPAINDPAKQSALFGQRDHVRIYALPEYRSRLTQAGFTVSYIPYQSLQAFYQYAIQKGEGFLLIKK